MCTEAGFEEKTQIMVTEDAHIRYLDVSVIVSPRCCVKQSVQGSSYHVTITRPSVCTDLQLRSLGG